MAVNNYKDKGSIIKFGGGVLKAMPVTDAGAHINTITITGITEAATAVASTSDTGTLEAGDSVMIEAVVDMIEVNDIVFTVGTVVTNTSFELSGIDSQGYTTYASGGTAKEVNSYDLGYINDTGLRFETETEDIPDETGQTINSVEGNDTVKLEGIFMQSSKNLLDFIRDNSVNVFYRLYYKASPTAGINGLTQELFVGIAKLQRMMDVKANTKRCPFEFTLLKNETAIVIAEPDVQLGAVTTTDATVGAEEYYIITET